PTLKPKNSRGVVMAGAATEGAAAFIFCPQAGREASRNNVAETAIERRRCIRTPKENRKTGYRIFERGACPAALHQWRAYTSLHGPTTQTRPPLPMRRLFADRAADRGRDHHDHFERCDPQRTGDEAAHQRHRSRGQSQDLGDSAKRLRLELPEYRQI